MRLSRIALSFLLLFSAGTGAAAVHFAMAPAPVQKAVAPAPAPTPAMDPEVEKRLSNIESMLARINARLDALERAK